MEATNLALVMAGLVTVTLWYLDQKVLACGTWLRLFTALPLIALSTWLVVVIHAAWWLKVPGAYGLVQYWSDGPGGGLDFMGIRSLALMLILVGCVLSVATLISAVVALFLKEPSPRWRRCLLPLVAVMAFASAYKAFFDYRFFPTA